MNRVIPVAYLRDRYNYCPITGVFTHKVGSKNTPPGSPAGHARPDGYHILKIPYEGKRYQIMAHIVAWAIHHGVWPEDDIDHKDTVRNHNWIENLRPATRSQNLANRNKTGPLPKGVTIDRLHKTKPYKAQLKHKGKNRYLGHFVDPMEAHQTYMLEATKVFGEFVRA